MRIAIDARELMGRPTGVGRYLTHLLAAWNALPAAREHEYLLYAPGPLEGRLPPLPDLRARARRAPGGGGTWWEQVRLPAALSEDHPAVLLSPAYTAPLTTTVPVVLALHDVSFFAHPEWFPSRVGFRRRIVTRLAARRARAILTISAFSGREIVARVGVPASRIRVVPLAVTTPGPPPVPPPGREPLVLYVGSIFNRRHLPTLIEAVARLAARRPEVRLAVVGEDRTYPRQDLPAVVRREGAEEHVTFASYVADGDLAVLYARAGAFAFLSDYEGFGLTPLEALAAGVPVVIGDTEVAREVCGDAARYVPTGDPAAVAAALESVLFDAATRARQLEAARGVLARHSWERVGRETLEILVDAARGGSGGRA